MRDQRPYDLAQQGFLMCMLEDDHERRLSRFIGGLRSDGRWNQADLDAVERQIREMLSHMELRE